MELWKEFTNRPEHDELAFLHYERSFRAPLEALAELQARNHDEYGTRITHFMQTYINPHSPSGQGAGANGARHSDRLAP